MQVDDITNILYFLNMINFGQREIDFYNKNGYLIINNVISEYA